MFKITKFNICIIGMLVGIGLICLLPFMGLTCRWGCAAVGGGQKVEEVLKPSSYYFMPTESTSVKNVCIMRSYLCVDTESIMASIQKEKRSCYLYSNKKLLVICLYSSILLVKYNKYLDYDCHFVSIRMTIHFLYIIVSSIV